MSNQYTLNFQTPGDVQVVLTRSFNAPRTRVFEALCQPDLLKQWLLGPAGWTMPECEVDLQVGGAYRYQWRGPLGQDMSAHGVFREILAPEHTIHTEAYAFSGVPQIGEQVVDSTLTEQDGVTTLQVTVTYAAKIARDMVVASGMALGVAASYDRLDALVAATPH